MTSVWGMLAKSAVDDETIEEAIARLILAHNENEESHLEAGQSLQSHKAAEIIDHLASSIVADKLRGGSAPILYGKNCIYSNFDSLDGLETGGVGTETITCVLGGTKMKTGAVNGDTVYIRCNPNAGMGANPNFDKNPVLSFRAKVMDRLYAECHCHIGKYTFQNGSGDYVGFKFDQGHIYCKSCRSGGAETSVDLGNGIHTEEVHDYRVEVTGAVKATFYIDDVAVADIETNVPWSNNEDSVFFFGVKNSQDAGQQAMGVFLASYQETI